MQHTNTQAKSQTKRKNEARDVPLIVSPKDDESTAADFVITAMPSRHHENALTICEIDRIRKRLRTITFQHDNIKAPIMSPMQFDGFENGSPS